ncbi:MAG: autotransporter-associated beta strand repeat-containing protein [Tepidisphaeraceae bacterium]
METDQLATGQWVHLALAIGGNTGVLYVDGKPRVAGQILLNPSNIAPTLNYIGKSQFSADPLFKGMVDDFRIYDYALDPGQVASFVFKRWTGEASSSWTIGAVASPKNWQSALSAVDYEPSSSVLFDDYATSFNVSITDATVTPSAVQFDNRNNNYTLSGPGAIAGSGVLTKNGAGVLTITNANAYAGGTLLNGGTLNLNNASAIGTGTLTIGLDTTINNTSGAAITLTTNNPQVWNGDFTFGGTNALNMGAGGVTLTGNRTVTTNGSAALTVGPIGESGGARSLTKAGPGTLVLTGASAYTGNTNVNAGTLNVTGSLASATTNVYTGSLVISGSHTNSGDVWIGLGNGGNGSLNVQSGATLTANTLLIGAAGTPTAIATGTGTLASGGTINTRQWLVIGQSGAAGSSGAFTVNGGTVNVHTGGFAAGNLEVGTFDATNATLNINAGAIVRLQNGASIVFGRKATTAASEPSIRTAAT